MTKYGNLYDYILWRGDLSFESDPINSIDAMLFSLIAYLKFENYINNESIILSEALKMIKENDITYLTSFKEILEIVDLTKSSKRYCDLELHSFEIIYDTSTEMQFAAVCITLPDNTIVIAFRGTDSSIIGWKEDFNLCFEDFIPSQNKALKYVEKIYKKYKTDIIISGHSKGGNLALYSFLNTDKNIADKVKNVYLYDIPGVRDSFINNENYINYSEKIISYIPEHSIVGAILNTPKNYKVIKTDAIGVLQHDVIKWNIVGKDFNYTYRSSISLDFQNDINAWLEKYDFNQRKNIVNMLFASFYEHNIRNIRQLVNKPQFVISLIKNIANITDEEKSDLFKLVLGFVKCNTPTITKVIEKLI